MKHSKAQIIATIGPASDDIKTLKAMVEHQLDVARLNFSWGDQQVWKRHIDVVRKAEKEAGRRIPILVDLAGPRVQEKDGHTYDHRAVSAITDNDKKLIGFAVEHNVDYIGVSFVGGPSDIEECREIIANFSGKSDAAGNLDGAGQRGLDRSGRGKPKIIAKIERAIALQSLDEIIAAADGVMVARGDLGNEVPLEQIPFIQDRIIKKAKAAGKPVIVATQMMLSMMESPTPTRAEVTDVANAILEGADAVMLSEESAKGKYPVEAVTMMEKIVVEAEKHLGKKETINHL
jgi:pyruvate kinase